MNRALIDTYKHIRDDNTLLTRELKKIQCEYYEIRSIEAKKEYYYAKRTEFNTKNRNSIRKSSLFIFLNKTGFNGMYRENSSGKYNIPFGKHTEPLICDVDNLLRVSVVLKQIDIRCGSYELATRDAKAGDFIYLDPPYEPINRTSSFTEYQAGGFSQDDQRRVCSLFRELSDRGCFVMMSNSTAELISQLYVDFVINRISVGRTINSAGSKRGKIEEVLVTNYKPNKGNYLQLLNEKL